mmetsp:Transcript_17917/g.27702  ORF Transcript_17917/g.27702 Transcript_17917/m.27702 type:complete len:457 (-) Transcript_17917:814-2184(-)
MLLVTSIYAILAVNFYADRSSEYFGNFTRALFTLFQICTGDGWASDIARPVFKTDGNGIYHEERYLDAGAAMFFISFIVIVGWTLLQVVVAVLLDNFTSAADQEKQRIAKDKQDREGRVPTVHSVDPLLAALAHFDTAPDLTHRIRLLFEVLDTDDSKSLSFQELSQGLKKLKVSPVINLSRDDFDSMTLGGALLNSEQEMGLAEFEAAMRRQLKLYVQRQMANCIELNGGEGHAGTILFVLKLLMIGVDDLQDTASYSALADSSLQNVPPPPKPETAYLHAQQHQNQQPASKPGGPALATRMDTLEQKMDGMQSTLEAILAKLDEKNQGPGVMDAFSALDPTRLLSPPSEPAEGPYPPVTSSTNRLPPMAESLRQSIGRLTGMQEETVGSPEQIEPAISLFAGMPNDESSEAGTALTISSLPHYDEWAKRHKDKPKGIDRTDSSSGSGWGLGASP